MFEEQINRMDVGRKLLEAPIPAIIEGIAKSIAKSQYELDATSVRIATRLAEERVALKDAEGKAADRSLIELGFLPTFYHFHETTIEVKMTISMKVESSFRFQVGGGIGNRAGASSTPASSSSSEGESESDGEEGEGDGEGESASPTAGPLISGPQEVPRQNTAVPYGAAVNMDIHHRFGFNSEGFSRVETKLAAVPAPSDFMDALRAHALGSAENANEEEDDDE